MKQIRNMMRLDFQLIRRDQAVCYIVLTPVIMSFLILFVIHAVSDRSMATVAGRPHFLRPVITAVLLSSPVVIGGIISGFNIVTEKEYHLNQAYQAAPLTTAQYFLARYLIALIAGAINLVSIAFILQAGSRLIPILGTTLFALPLFAFSPIIIGCLANDKMGIISVIKILMLVFLVMPIASAYTPARYQFFYYVLPIYWHYKSIFSILAGNINWCYSILTLLTGMSFLLILLIVLGPRMQMMGLDRRPVCYLKSSKKQSTINRKE